MVTAVWSALAAAVFAAASQAPAAPAEMLASSAAKPAVVADSPAVRPPETPIVRDEKAIRASDAELSMRLLKRLMKSGYLTNSCMAIAASDSGVRIEGLVRKQRDLSAIERLVAAEPGVSRVTNNLKTGSCPSPRGRPFR